MNSLFIAQTPLQLLNCIEASKKYNEKGVFVLFFDCHENYKRMQDLVSLFEIKQVYYYSLNATFRVFFPIILINKFRKLKKEKSFEKVYFGTYASWASFLINYLEVFSTVLVDDGSKTIIIINSPERMGLDKKKWLKLLQKDYVQKSSLFTIYFELAKKNRLVCEKNNLENVISFFNFSGSKDKYSKNPFSYDNKQICIGSYISNKCDSFDDHIAILANKARESGKELLYIMHRYDDETKFSQLANIYNFKCVKFDLPLELVFSSIWNGTDEVWSQGSTAVDTLQLIYPSLSMRIFQMPLETINTEFQRENFLKLYQYYSEKERLTLDKSFM